MATSMIVLLMLIVIVILFILGILMKKNKNVIKVCIFTGVLCILCIFVFGIYHLYFYDNEKKVEIHTSTEGDSTFVLPIKNHKLKYEYTYTSFSTEMELEKIADEIKKTNPADNVELSTEGIKIIQNNHVVTIRQQKESKFLWKRRYEYNMMAEFLNLTFSQNCTISIPFPTDYLEIEGSYKKVMNISCDMEKLKKFYEHFTNVDMGGNSILLKMESGQTIKITLEGQKVKFEEEKTVK